MAELVHVENSRTPISLSGVIPTHIIPYEAAA